MPILLLRRVGSEWTHFQVAFDTEYRLASGYAAILIRKGAKVVRG